MSVTEILGFVTGAVSVWLTVKENVWLWPVGLANSAFFLVLFWGAGLFADSVLQILYIVLGVYGWWNWLYGGSGRTELAIRRAGPREAVWLGAATLLGTLVVATFLARYTSSTVPLWDGITTVGSITATYMLTKKVFETWYVWIAVDVLYIPLYAYKGLYLTAIVYAVFLAMCVRGLIEWRRSLAAEAVLGEAVV